MKSLLTSALLFILGIAFDAVALVVLDHSTRQPALLALVEWIFGSGMVLLGCAFIFFSSAKERERVFMDDEDMRDALNRSARRTWQ